MRKYLTISLICALILASACGDAPVSDTNNNTTDVNDTTVDETAEYIPPDVNYSGETFTILDYVTDDYFWQAASYSVIHAEEESGDTINDAQWKRNRAVEEQLGVNIEIYGVGGSNRKQPSAELLKLVMANEDVVDIGFGFGNYMSSLLTLEGGLININDIPTVNYEASWWDQAAIDAYSINDNFKIITGDISIYSSFAAQLCFFNKNVAEIYEITDLYDRVRNGTWTFDYLYDCCRKASDDLNGDTQMDKNDRFGIALQNNTSSSLALSCGVELTRRNESGDLELALNNERTSNIMEDVVTLINDYNVACNAVNYSADYNNVFYELHIPMFKNDQLLFNTQQLLVSFELRAMETDYGLLPRPKYDETQENYRTVSEGSWTAYLCVPSTNTRLEMTGHIMDALGYYSQQYVTPEFIDTTVRYKSLRDEDSAEMLEIVLGNRVYDLCTLYNWGDAYTLLNMMAVENNTNFASEYASIATFAETEMNETIELMSK